jgi:hypothetical protein
MKVLKENDTKIEIKTLRGTIILLEGTKGGITVETDTNSLDVGRVNRRTITIAQHNKVWAKNPQGEVR